MQQELAIRCTTIAADGAQVRWSYLLDGSETRYHVGGESRSSVVKWEGAALLINTIVSGRQNYTVMDRWRLSRDRSALTIMRQIVNRGGEAEATLVYRPEAQAAAAEPAPAPVATPEPPPAAEPPRAGLVRKPPPPEPSDIVIRAGTRIPLALRNTVDTKHSHEGDHIYLETTYPIVVDGVIVVPRGSFVNGTVTASKPPKRGTGRGQLYIRFDALILPNGVTRDFRSRLGSADASAKGEVDRDEGKVTGERDKGKDARTVATGTAIGTGAGGVVGAAAGHPLGGVGIGAAAGAAAGLGTIFSRRGADASLPQGTMVEMILDRDLRFTRADLRF